MRDVDCFSSEKNEDAEEFLETLDDKVLEGRLNDFKILGAISTVFFFPEKYDSLKKCVFPKNSDSLDKCFFSEKYASPKKQQMYLPREM